MTDSEKTEGPITWEKGGGARVLEAKGEQVTLRSTVPYPPGAPVPGTLRDGEGAGHGFVVKVAGSKKVSPTEWDVKGRLVTATVAVREAFAKAAPAG